MSKVIAMVLAFLSLSSLAQVITGGSNNGQIQNPFEFQIRKKAEATYSGKSVGFFSDKNEIKGDVYCDAGFNAILYFASNGIRIDFLFENNDKCMVVKACVNKKSDSEVITVKVDRNTKLITGVALPASCSLDIWSSDI